MQLTGTLYYLQTDTDRDRHDTECCCGMPTDLPHTAIGVSLYKLNMTGLRKLYQDIDGEDGDAFDDWCYHQDAQSTCYGVNEEAAIADAIAVAKQEGALIVNYPEHFPWIQPVLAALSGVLEEQGSLALCPFIDDDDITDNDEDQDTKICPLCYAHFLSTLLSYYGSVVS